MINFKEQEGNTRCPRCGITIDNNHASDLSKQCPGCGYVTSPVNDKDKTSAQNENPSQKTETINMHEQHVDNKNIAMEQMPGPGNDPIAGMEFSKFRVLRKIGSGGMADVYLGYQESLDRHVAIKILPTQLARQKDFVARFLREAKSAARLNHPNIITIHDVGCQHDLYYILMEYIDGMTVGEYIARNGKFPLEKGLKVIKDVALALEYAHEHGLIHRDIKPDNIMLGPGNRTVVTDFGIARAKTDTKLTATSMTIGTPRYMSPEQAKGEKLDYRSDLYSLGVMAFEMLTGSLPFKATDPVVLAMKHAHDPLPSITKFNPGIPPTVQDLVERMLEKNPGDRFQSGGEIAAFLGKPRDMPVVMKRKTAVKQPDVKPTTANTKKDVTNDWSKENLAWKRKTAMFTMICFIMLIVFTMGIFYLRMKKEQALRLFNNRISQLENKNVDSKYPPWNLDENKYNQFLDSKKKVIDPINKELRSLRLKKKQLFQLAKTGNISKPELRDKLRYFDDRIRKKQEEKRKLIEKFKAELGSKPGDKTGMKDQPPLNQKPFTPKRKLPGNPRLTRFKKLFRLVSVLQKVFLVLFLEWVLYYFYLAYRLKRNPSGPYCFKSMNGSRRIIFMVSGVVPVIAIASW